MQMGVRTVSVCSCGYNSKLNDYTAESFTTRQVSPEELTGGGVPEAVRDFHQLMFVNP